MRIMWDEPKRLANLAKHGLGFADLTPMFFGQAIVAPAHSGRYRAFGQLGGAWVTVVFAVLGTKDVSIVSVRRASSKEKRER